MAGLHDNKTDDELIAAMRGNPAQSPDYIELNAELERRVALSSLAASRAQIRSAWYQFAALIAMFLTALMIATIPWFLSGGD